MQLTTFIVTNDSGLVLPGATVTVYLAGTMTLATLHNPSGAAIGNPISADGTGAAIFSAADGQYDLALSYSSYSRLVANVGIYDIAQLAKLDLSNVQITVPFLTALAQGFASAGIAVPGTYST